MNQSVQMEQRIFEAGLELDVSEQEEIGHGDPDLSHHGIFRGAQEVFDFEMLLDPLEEKLDLPASFVKLGDGPGGKEEVVGEKIVCSLGFRIIETDEAQRPVIFFFGIEA